MAQKKPFTLHSRNFNSPISLKSGEKRELALPINWNKEDFSLVRK